MHLFNTQLFQAVEPDTDTDTARPDPVERPRYGNHLWTRQAQAFARRYGHRQAAQAAAADARCGCE